MCPEHLLAELFVTSVLHSVDLESVGVCVNVMVLREHVAHGPEGKHDAAYQSDDDLGVGNLVFSYELKIFRDIVSHLGS